MIDYAKEHAKELKRREPLQQRPEFREWLSEMEAGLDEFFSRVVPDMPSDRYTADGLRHAERAALQLFPASRAASPTQTPRNATDVDRFHRYLGEAFARQFEGTWLYIDMSEDRGPEPVVELPFAGSYHAPRGLLITAMRRRTGDRWAGIFDRDRSEYHTWVDAGRPSTPDWLRQQLS